MLRRLFPAALAFVAGCGDTRDGTPSNGGRRLVATTPAPASPTVSVQGIVVDRDTREPVVDVEVVLRGEHGDVSTRSRADGTFSVSVPRGDYRAFVRDARVMSTGLQGRVRVKSVPRAELAGVADEQLMSVVTLDTDATGIELPVVAAAIISGTVLDPARRPVENVVIHAAARESTSTGTQPQVGPPIARRAAPRPVLGTDTVISDENGHFVLRVPPGRYELVADHPRFGGIAGLAEIELDAGVHHDTRLTLARGCIISGKVVGSDGKPAHDGAIEVRESFAFGPSGRISPDGTFRWTAPDDGDVIFMRAWPWQSAPSPIQMIPCNDGGRHTDIVFRAGNAKPDLKGTLSDAHGNPVPLAYLDIQPLDGGPDGQQERADAGGTWEVYELPAGRYEITAHAPGRGIVSTIVVAPREDVALQLGGTGTLAGTTTELVDGSFELTFHHCGAPSNAIELSEQPRIVLVRGGRFSVPDAPACALTFSARWRGRVVTEQVVVETDRTAFVELDVGKPREKLVRGTVRDAEGKAVGGVRITAVVDNQEATSIRAEADGSYELKTQSGAELVAGDGRHAGRASVGRANVAAERVDIVIDDAE